MIASTHQKKDSEISFQTMMNINNYEDQYLSQLKQRLEDELMKNEKLERKIRESDFNHLIKINELARKIQQLDMENQHLISQLSDDQNQSYDKSPKFESETLQAIK